jgi:diguanylate cyclase (GGDEF)-like protein
MELPQLNRASLESPYARQLEEGFSKLHFNGLLEKDFREFYTAQNLPRGRQSALIALVLVAAVTIIEYIFGTTDLSSTTHALRLGVLCPVLGLVVLTTYLDTLKRRYEQVVIPGVILVGLTTTYIAQLAALSGDSYLLAGVVLVNLYACLFLGLRFNLGVGIAAGLVAGHVIMGIGVGLPLNALLYTTALLLATTIIGAISTYSLEHALRTSFLETRLFNELAQRDGLTGLYNRRLFDDYIRRVWRQARREKVALEILLIDIDYFKIFNDLYGHQAGDDCLKSVAQAILKVAKRPFDFSARDGGEEFVLILYGPPDDYARSTPEELRRDVMDLAIVHEGSHAAQVVTVSIGVAIADPSMGRSLTGAIQAADEALYEAKQAGWNMVIFKDASESEVETGNFRVAVRETG